jgi:hypothetical protein
VKKYFADTLPGMYSMPFSFNDHDEVMGYLQRAGFSSIVVEQVEKSAWSTNAREAAIGLTQGSSLYNEIVAKDPAWVEAIINDTEAELVKRYGDQPMIAPMSAVFAMGRKG